HLLFSDATINYAGLNAGGIDGYSKLQIYPKAGSVGALYDDPPFYIREYHFDSGNLQSLTFAQPPYTNYYQDGQSVSVALSATATAGLPSPVFSATHLPPGLPVNPSTGLISGTISANAYTASPYTSTLTATAGPLVRNRTMAWYISSAISFSFPTTSG